MSRRAPRSRNTLRIAQLLTCFLAASALVVGTVAPATAASASVSSASNASLARASADPAATGIVKSSLVGFNAGNIISDAVFTDSGTMTEAQIQSFFNSKVARCLGGKDENGKPIVCLKDFRISSVTRPADAYCDGYTGAANESAARIIYRVAKSCDINPRVLIVMLQKEQGLITHTWPSAWRFNIALGQGCPDTAPCDPNYIGFFHQIYGAARQMQIYMEGKWFQWYAPGKTWNILYNPKASCGSSPVRVANKATSALYYYTPYQPNAAALRAGYGEGNGCSAYGNRNFYNYFTDWFGSTQRPGTPAAVPPKLTSVDKGNFVAGVDEGGGIWGYPYSKGVWGARVQLGSGLPSVTRLVDVGDFDGDGNRDFIAFDKAARASLLQSDGGMKLSAPVSLPGDWSGIRDLLLAGDFDGDGYADVFTVSETGDLYLRASTGFAGFRAPVRVGSGWIATTPLFGGVDLNGDKKPDLVGRDKAGNLWLYPGDGRGGWASRLLMGHGWSTMTSVFSPGDFDGDGRSDLLAHTADGRLALYRGLANGKVTSAGIVGSGWNALPSKAGVVGAVSGVRVHPGGFGNVDGRSGNDVVALSTAGEALVYGGNGTGKFGVRSTIAKGWNKSDSVVPLGDFNRDGYRDLGRIDSAGEFFFLAGKAGGGFAAPVVIGHGWGGFTNVVGGLDFDGDRMTDVVATTADGLMMLYPGNGRGGWGPGTGAQISHGWTIADQVFYAGDFDGDGRGDMIARLTDGTLRKYPLTGTGAFSAAVQIGHGWGDFAAVFSPGDFNGDGKSDMIAVDDAGLMYLYPGTGTGSMRARVQIGSGWKTMSAIG